MWKEDFSLASFKWPDIRSWFSMCAGFSFSRYVYRDLSQKSYHYP